MFVFDGRTGRLLKKWGEKTLALPHSITVDSKDNIWIADVVLHQVFKFSHDGKLLLKLGNVLVAGDDTSHFDQPSDVAVARDGSFYVSDGYGNNRVVKFGADGKFLLQWGIKGKNAGQFLDIHWVAVAKSGAVYTADFEVRRVQKFVRGKN